MTFLRFRRVAPAVAAAAALGIGACGTDDVNDRADDVRDEAREATRDIENQADELRDDIRSGASEADIRERLDDLEREARGKGKDVEREAEELRRELEEQVP